MAITVTHAWQRRIDEAQDIKHDSVAGVELPRVPYGEERSLQGIARLKPQCRDCAVALGQLHVSGCCVEACPRCQGQAIGCSCLDTLH